MPGKRGQTERSLMVQLRLTAAEAERWRAHVQTHGGYLSALIRRAVEEHLLAARGSKRCQHW